MKWVTRDVVIYDALYAWCRSLQKEVHTRQPEKL